MKTKLQVSLAPFILCAVLVLSLAAGSCGKKPESGKSLDTDLTGQWNGTLKVNDVQLRLVLKVSKAREWLVERDVGQPRPGRQGSARDRDSIQQS